jgi:hypothetical protein
VATGSSAKKVARLAQKGKGKKVMSSQDINKIFKNGRHFKFF